jgi:beta-galactosidase/beta-glucuronidase
VPIEWARHFADAIGKPYASPPAQPAVPLTDEQILNLAENCTAQYHDLLSFGRAVLAAAQPAPVQPVTLEEYDAGLLNDYGGGNVEWWQDYIRAELGRAYENYQSQITTPPAAQPAVQEPTDGRVKELADRYGLDASMIGALRNFADAYHASTAPPAAEFVCSTRLCHYKAQPAPVPMTDEDVVILEAVRREMEDKVYSKNAPGHAHHTPGIWDEDNGDLAGKPCAWCLTWKKFTKLIEREAASGITKGQP